MLHTWAGRPQLAFAQGAGHLDRMAVAPEAHWLPQATNPKSIHSLIQLYWAPQARLSIACRMARRGLDPRGDNEVGTDGCALKATCNPVPTVVKWVGCRTPRLSQLLPL